MKKPLFFLDNKPVYKNDILHWEIVSNVWKEHKVHHVDDEGKVWDSVENNPAHDTGWLLQEDLRFARPVITGKKHGWINLFEREGKPYTSFDVFDTKEQAEEAGKNFVARSLLFGVAKFLSTNKVEWEE